MAFMDDVISVLKIRNKIGPKLEPCGTPEGAVYVIDLCKHIIDDTLT